MAMVLSSTIFLSAITMTSVAQETEPAPESSTKQVVDEIVEVLDFEDGTEGFTSTDSSVLVTTSTDFKLSGESSLKITPTASKKTYGVAKVFEELQVGKKITFNVYKNRWDRVAVMQLNGGTRVLDENGLSDNAENLLFGLFAGASSSDSRLRFLAQYWDNSKNSLQYVRDEDGKVLESDYRVTQDGWYEMTIDMSIPGEVSFYVEDELQGVVELPDGVYADFKTMNFLNSWSSAAGGDIYIDDITISQPAPVATSPVVDDEENTFNWTFSPITDAIDAYEYSTDGGATWTTCNTKPLNVGNVNLEANQVQVRVKADESENYVFPAISNETAYTFTHNVNIDMEDTSDINFFNDWGSSPPIKEISTEYSRSGLESLKLSSNSRSTFSARKDYGSTMVTEKVITAWFYDEMNSSSSNYNGIFSVQHKNVAESMVGVNNSQSKTNYVIRSKPGTTSDWNTWNKTSVTRSEGWHCFQWDFTSGDTCAIYIDGVLVKEYETTGFNLFAFNDSWSQSDNTYYIDDITITDSRDDVKDVPNAPTNAVVNDTADTLDWTYTEGFTSETDYEYSTDNGETFMPVTSKPQIIGDWSYDAGEVMIRVKADATNNTDKVSGSVLRTTADYTSTYADNLEELQVSIDFALGFFEGDYSDATKWTEFEQALAHAMTITDANSRVEVEEAITSLDLAITGLENCFAPENYVIHKFEDIDGLYPFYEVSGNLTKGEATSMHGETLTQGYNDRRGAQLTTELVSSNNIGETIYTFAKPMEDYILEIAWEHSYPPLGTTDLLIMDKEGLNGVGIRASKGATNAFFELVIIENGKETVQTTNIRMSSNCSNTMRFDFVNPQSGVDVTIDERPILDMIDGVANFRNNIDLDSFEQIVFRTTNSSSADSFIFDNVTLMKANPVDTIVIEEDTAELGYFDIYNLSEVLLDITAVDPSYPTTDAITYTTTSDVLNVTNGGVVEPMNFGTAVVEVRANSIVKDSITINYVDRKAEDVYITDAPSIDIAAMGAAGQDTNNSIPVEETEFVELMVGESVVLNAVITPEGTTERLVDWQSLNSDVAHVKDGLVTAINYGVTEIKVTTKDGTNKTDTITVVVKDEDHVYGKELFVSVDGDDTTGDGSIEKPFATIEKARDFIAESELPEGGVIVYFREGTYRISNTIAFNEENSGEEGKPITYASYQDEEVTFNGAMSIPLNDLSLVESSDESYDRLHADAKGEVYAIDIMALGLGNKDLKVVGHSAGGLSGTGFFSTMNFSQNYYTLNYNNSPMTLARFPNENEMVDEDAGMGYVLARIEYHGADSRGWSQDMIVAGNGREYVEGAENDTFKISSTSITQAQLDAWQTALDGDPTREDAGGQGAWMEGYWGTDYSNQTVPIESISGNVIESGLISHYRLGQFNGGHIKFYVYNLLEELDIPGEWYIDQISSEDEMMLYFYPPTTADMTSEEETINIPTLNEVMISITDANYITFDGINLTNMNAGAYKVSGGSYNVLQNSDISNSGGGLVNISNSTNNLARFNGINMCDIDYIDGGISLNGGDVDTLERGYNYVKDTTISTFSMINRSYNAAVNLGGVGNIVSNTVLNDAPHSAIGFGGPESLIQFVEAYDVIQEANDQGIIYTGRDMLNQGTIIRNCYLHDISYVGTDKNTAIYLDDSKSGVAVLDNVLENTTLGIKSGGRNVQIIGNLMVNQETGVVVDPSGFIATGPTLMHGYNLISNPGNYSALTTRDWQTQTGPYSRFYMQWATLIDDPLDHNKYKSVIDNEFINIERVEDPRDVDGYYGVDIWTAYWEQLPFEYLMEEYVYDTVFTKNNNGLDSPEDGLEANPPVASAAYAAQYEIKVMTGTGEGEVAGNQGSLIIGSTKKVIATPEKGFEFLNWTNADGQIVSTNAIFIFDVDSNETLTANFAETTGPLASGDANEDGNVNNKDLFLMLQYISNPQSVAINIETADVNEDGFVNNADVLQLFATVSQVFQ